MEMTTVKTVAVFAIMFGCFAILYPKIFHPMLLHILGMNQPTSTAGIGANDPHRMPQHMPGAGAGRIHPGKSDPNPMRGVPHPGMRAAAEMKKQAAATHGQGGGGKGMMGVVLPMYAVGIVLYLVYTMAKVMTRKDDKSSKSGEGHGRSDYLTNHFADVKRSARDGRGGGVRETREREGEGTLSMKEKVLRQQEDLERLLLRADKEDISEGEMSELKRKLLETEAQMSRILHAMEAVQQKVSTISDASITAGSGTEVSRSTAHIADSSSQAPSPDNVPRIHDDYSDDGEQEYDASADEYSSEEPVDDREDGVENVRNNNDSVLKGNGVCHKRNAAIERNVKTLEDEIASEENNEECEGEFTFREDGEGAEERVESFRQCDGDIENSNDDVKGGGASEVRNVGMVTDKDEVKEFAKRKELRRRKVVPRKDD